MAIDAEAICRIIKQCGQSKVTRFAYQGLELQFSSDRELELPKTEILTSMASPPAKIQELSPEAQAAIEEFEELNLAIDDPIAWEKAQMNEGVERAWNEGTEPRGTEQALLGRGLSG